MNKERYREAIREFRLFDDTYMTVFFKDRACAELLIRILLDDKDLKLTRDPVTQLDIKNLHGHSVRLDLFAEDSKGRQINVEIQRAKDGANFRRARYNSSLIDANVFDPGEQYENLAETYVIFITEEDVIGDGLPIYHLDTTIKETGKAVDDGRHIIYVNGEIKDQGTELGRLMHDFSCKEPLKMLTPVLAEHAHALKDDEKGGKEMCEIMEKLIEEGRVEALAEGMATGRAEGLATGRAEGMATGRIEGLEKGISTLVQAYQELGIALTTIIQKVAEKYDLSLAESESKVRQYMIL